MAEKDDKLVESDEMFDAGNADDMAEFLDLLNSIDVGGDSIFAEPESSGEENITRESNEMQSEEIRSEASDGEVSESVENGLNQDGQSDGSEEEDVFMPEEDAGIMDFLDSAGTEQIAVDDAVAAADAMIANDDVMSMTEEVADEGAGEIASFLENLDEETSEEEADTQPGLLNKMFHKEPTEEELIQQMQDEADEKAWEAQQLAEAEEKKKRKLEKKQEKQAAAELKKQQKQEKQEAKAAAKKEKAQAREEPRRAERGNMPRSMIVPKKPVIAAVLIGIAFSVLFVVFINYRFYNSCISEAKEQFIHRQYGEAYEAVVGLDVKEKDEKFLEQAKIIRMVDKDLDAYKNYMKVDDYEHALVSLVNGIGKYDSKKERAKELSLEKEMYNLYEELVQEVSVQFKITAQDALNLYKMTDKTKYDKQIVQIARDAALRDGVMEPVAVDGQ